SIEEKIEAGIANDDDRDSRIKLLQELDKLYTFESFDLFQRRVSNGISKNAVWDCGSSKAPGPDARSWIRACVSSSRASVLVNGSPTLKFSIKQCLRQGDPLSPFLFILVMEGLHKALSTVVSSGLIRGVKFGSPEVTVSHQFYADDVIITTEWNVNDLDNIIRVLQVFYLASGIKSNIQKSNVYGLRFWMPMSLPWPVLLDRFQSKLSSWKANLLSIGGRHTLIKVVLGSLMVLEVVIAQNALWVKVIKALHGQKAALITLVASITSLGTDGAFLVKDARCIIDSKILPSLAPSTVWDKNISRKAISCPSFNGNVESSNHIFFECNIAKDILMLIRKWCDISFPPFTSYEH
ncbi:putative RNA-directed DNA polymerase, eukaryota, reverse transcriptase zinc-binding domain protein, partial [Tanacetum coccineum]